VNLADAGATEKLGARLASLVRPGDCIALFGTLGAGKTSLCRGLIHALGFQGDVASPTFPIVLAYEPPELRLPVWHVDLYRIEAGEEIEELGLDEARVDALLLIEWPERLPHLWADALRLTLTHAPAGGRSLTAEIPAAWELRWPPR
jgi:tRNA threonylcarbamoyladenosine biosynthesis protein TsaE